MNFADQRVKMANLVDRSWLKILEFSQWLMENITNFVNSSWKKSRECCQSFVEKNANFVNCWRKKNMNFVHWSQKKMANFVSQAQKNWTFRQGGESRILSMYCISIKNCEFCQPIMKEKNWEFPQSLTGRRESNFIKH